MNVKIISCSQNYDQFFHKYNKRFTFSQKTEPYEKGVTHDKYWTI